MVLSELDVICLCWPVTYTFSVVQAHLNPCIFMGELVFANYRSCRVSFFLSRLPCKFLACRDSFGVET